MQFVPQGIPRTVLQATIAPLKEAGVLLLRGTIAKCFTSQGMRYLASREEHPNSRKECIDGITFPLLRCCCVAVALILIFRALGVRSTSDVSMPEAKAQLQCLVTDLGLLSSQELKPIGMCELQVSVYIYIYIHIYIYMHIHVKFRHVISVISETADPML